MATFRFNGGEEDEGEDIVEGKGLGGVYWIY